MEQAGEDQAVLAHGCGAPPRAARLDQPVDQRQQQRARAPADRSTSRACERNVFFSSSRSTPPICRIHNAQRSYGASLARRSGIGTRSSRRHPPAPPIPPPGRIQDHAIQQQVEAVGVRGAQQQAFAVGVELGLHHVVLLEQPRGQHARAGRSAPGSAWAAPSPRCARPGSGLRPPRSPG